MFAMYDLDGNGFLSKDEFFTMMRYGVGPSSPETSCYFKQENRSGQRRVGGSYTAICIDRWSRYCILDTQSIQLQSLSGQAPAPRRVCFFSQHQPENSPK